jgi:hypothetical protein
MSAPEIALTIGGSCVALFAILLPFCVESGRRSGIVRTGYGDKR